MAPRKRTTTSIGTNTSNRTATTTTAADPSGLAPDVRPKSKAKAEPCATPKSSATKPKAKARTKATAPPVPIPPPSPEPSTDRVPSPAPDRADEAGPQSLEARTDPEAWKDAWSRAAAETTSVVAACKKVGITVLEYLMAQHQDPEFNTLCRVHDGIVDECIKDSLRTLAASGDPRSQALYYTRVRELISPDLGQCCDKLIVSATEAEAIIRTAIEILESRADPIGHAPSAPSSSRPRPQLSFQSKPIAVEEEDTY